VASASARRLASLPPIGTEIVLYVSDLEDMCRLLTAADYEPGRVAFQPWGDRDFRITDPDGYYLRISEGRPVPAPDSHASGLTELRRRLLLHHLASDVEPKRTGRKPLG